MTIERTLSAPATPAASGDAATVPVSSGLEATLPASPSDSASSTVPTLGVGTRYDVREELGRGGMGRVAVAVDHSLEREVALKDLLAAPGEGASVAATARFVREARVTGRLEHPGIVPVYELGRHSDGRFYYTMKRIRGRSLASALAETRTLGERLSLLGHFRDVCNAIAYAHSKDVVHRDLKPANVMIGAFGETLVVDWGLAKVRGEKDLSGTAKAIDDAAKTMDGAAIGTPSYMSPEQARGDLDAIDAASDVWGLGAILFELLTGRPPFVGPTGLAVVAQVLAERPPRVRELVPSAPAELAAIADRALRHSGARYASAAELAADVAAFLEGREVGAYRYSTWELVRRLAARNRAAAIATLAVTATVVFGAVAVGFYAIDANRERDRADEARAATEVALGEATEARERATASEVDARSALSEALLERAERALADHQPAIAAVWAAASLREDPVDDPTDEAARSRDLRARSVYAAAEDARTLVFDRAIDAPSPPFTVSDDARFLAGPAEGGIAVEDLETRTRTLVPIDGEALVASAMIGTDRILVRGGAPGVYEIATGRRLLALPPFALGMSSGGHAAVLTVEGETLVLTEAADGIHARFATTSIARFSWSRDGSFLVLATAAQDVEIYAWPDFARPRRRVVATSRGTRWPHVSPDGSRIVVGVTEPSFLLETERGIVSVPATGWTVGGGAWPSADTLVTSEGEGSFTIRDAATGAPREVVAVPEAASRVVVGEARAVRLPQSQPDTESPAAYVYERRPARRRELECGAGVQDFVVDAAGDFLVLLGDRVLPVVAEHGGLDGLAPVGPPDASGVEALTSIAAGPDGSVAVISWSSQIWWWRGSEAIVTTEPIEGPPNVAIGLAFASDGSELFAARSGEGDVRRIARDGTETVLHGHHGVVRDIAVSPDGRTLATASDDRTVRLWHLPGGGPYATLEGHEGLAAAVAFSPDGTRLATADGGGTIRVYALDGTPSCSIRAYADWVNRIAFLPDGEHLVGGSDDGTVRIVAADCSRVERILRVEGIGIRALGLGTDVVFADGRHMVRVPALPEELSLSVDELFERAEGSAGVRVDGLDLVHVSFDE